MVSNANRWAGVCVAALALLFLIFIIPNHSSASDYGWMRPRTLPTICAVALILLGLALAFFPSGQMPPGNHLRAVFIMGVLALALVGFAYGGFLIAAPLLMAVLMLVSGERRPLWLFIGVATVPLLIWFVVTIILGRPLF